MPEAVRAPAGPASAPTSRVGGLSTWDLALLVALAFLWGSAYISIREGILLGASPELYAAVRYAFSALAFAAIAMGQREPWPGRRPLLVSAVVGGILVIGLYGGLLYWGEQYTTGGYASVLSSTSPILTVVIAYSLLPAERLRRLSLLGILIGFAGAVVLVAPDLARGGVGGWPGPLFIIGAFLSTSIGTVLLRRIGGGRQGMWQIGSQFGVAAALLMAVSLAVPGQLALPLTAPLWAALAALVGFSSIGGYFVYYVLHHRVGPVRANIVAYLLPLVGIGLGSGLFGEAVSAWEIVGFLIVLGGVTLVVRGSGNSP